MAYQVNGGNKENTLYILYILAMRWNHFPAQSALSNLDHDLVCFQCSKFGEGNGPI